jgi:hypothetical protein
VPGEDIKASFEMKRTPSPPTSTSSNKMAHLEQQQVDLDEKPADPEHQEISAHASSDYELKKSRFDDLSIPRTLWVFRKTALVVLSVYTGQSMSLFLTAL